ncbi:hypothetical protein [Roseobacter sp.]|uniref:NfeD family protein n=1 Tax=Roseobacter sp. TaxID=1907202 RepID=UPI0025FF6BC8|nr:hypothetical protein [Roseobacter sp.]
MVDALLSLWWIWVAVALVLGIIEVLAPGFIFLGFALGALVTAALVAFGYVPSAAVLFAVFGGVSLLAWVGLRFAFRGQTSGARIVTRDINDN